MSKVGLWQIQSGQPVRLEEVPLDLEKNLEDWIEHDPSLVQKGIVIIGRQIRFEGGRLDLLALDPVGRWIVIEIKAGAVSPDTITQALYYSAYLSRIPTEDLHQKANEYLRPRGRTIEELLNERGITPQQNTSPREIMVMLVGTFQASGMNKVVDLLVKDYKFPLTIVTFDIHQTSTGDQILTRELNNEFVATPQSTGTSKKQSKRIDDLQKEAETNNVGVLFKKILETASQHGLYPHLWPTAIMFTAPQNHTKMLFTMWTKVKKNGFLTLYLGYSAFTEFYPITEEETANYLGPEGWRLMDQVAVDDFIGKLDQLFKLIEEKQTI